MGAETTTVGDRLTLRSRLTASGERRVATLATLLVTLVVVAVPLGAVAFDLPVTWLLLGAAATYVAAVVAMGRPFEGLVVALIVAAAFNFVAHLHVVELDYVVVRLVDVLAVVTLGTILVRRGFDRGLVGRSGPLIVVGSFAVFVLWTILTTVVGNGPSTEQSLEYAVEHLRYLLLLVTTALVVAETDPNTVVTPLAIGLGGALFFAVDTVFGGHAGYLINFGPFETLIRDVWPSTFVSAVPRLGTIVYDGVIGHNRTVVGLGIVFLPLVLAAATRSRRHGLLAAAGLLAVVNVVASGSHAALVGLYAGVVSVAVYVVYLALDRFGPERARNLVVPVSAVLGTVIVVGIVVATAAGMDELLFVRTNNMEPRLRQYTTAVELAVQHPLFGVGGGWNFYLVAGEGIHNLYLANLAATGIPGFLAFLMAQTAVTWLCLRRLRERPVGERWVWVGVVAGLFGFYAYTFWTVAHWWPSLNALYWLLAGVVVGASSSAADSRGLGRLVGQRILAGGRVDDADEDEPTESQGAA